MKLFKYLSILVLLTFLVAAFFPQAAVTAQVELKGGGGIPTQKSPHGTILATSPTYKWTVISTAVQYEYQVWKGSTKVVDKVVNSGSCTATLCSKNPGVSLSNSVYKWRVRSKVGSTWNSWSVYMEFFVSAPSFTANFNGSMADDGWARRAGGDWYTTGGFLVTKGLLEKFSTAYRTSSQYSDVDFSALIYQSQSSAPKYLMVRAGPLLVNSNLMWGPGYMFGISNSGDYAVLRGNSNGTSTVIQSWTVDAHVAVDTWNTLRVVAKGSNFKFYINGYLVKTFSDNTIARGSVGLMTYKQTVSDGAFYADWAKLTVLVTTQ
jgi:hypothetical protein